MMIKAPGYKSLPMMNATAEDDIFYRLELVASRG